MKQQGFTLVEVLLVTALLAVLAGMVVPGINRLAAVRELDIAARQLAADMRWMQQLSINSTAGSTGAGLPFDPHPSLHFYTTAPYGYYITVNAVPVRKHYFPPVVQIHGSYNTISFGIHGYVNNAYGLRLRLYSDGRTKDVVVDAAGRIRIE